MKKTIVISLIFALIMMVMSGCQDVRSFLDPSHPVTLSLWHIYNSHQGSPLNETVMEFNNTVGKEKGVYVQVTSVLDSRSIDEALMAAYEGKPWVGPLPDLFTAFPKSVEMDKEILLDWGEYYSEQELAEFIPDFLNEGIMDGRLLMLPIAKASEILTINKTLFDEFASQTGISEADLRTFEGCFETCMQYYDWSEGKQMMQFSDFYHYFTAGMKSYGMELIHEEKVDITQDVFFRLYQPLAEAAVYGGLCIGKGYVSDRWKTAEIISSINSSAELVYMRDYVTYPDNTKTEIETRTLPYPLFKEGEALIVQNGAGLFAKKSEDPRKNKAAVLFAKWLVEKNHNIPFVVNSGYLPVQQKAYLQIDHYLENTEDEKIKDLYRTVNECKKEYSLVSLPYFPGSGQVQQDFEQKMRNILEKYREKYRNEVHSTADPQALLDQLVLDSYEELKRK